MTTLEILKAARAKIAKPENWCQGFSGATAEGVECYVQSPTAAKWCILGACSAVSSPKPHMLDQICEAMIGTSSGLAHFNDSHTHAEVLALFDSAISKLEAI